MSLFCFRSSPVHIFGNSNSLHSYARPPLASSAPNPSRSHLRERRRVRVTFHFSPLKKPWLSELNPDRLLNCSQQASSESESGVFSMSSSFSDDEDMVWSQSWPSTAWHCFLKGTHTLFLSIWMEAIEISTRIIISRFSGYKQVHAVPPSKSLRLLYDFVNIKGLACAFIGVLMWSGRKPKNSGILMMIQMMKWCRPPPLARWPLLTNTCCI